MPVLYFVHVLFIDDVGGNFTAQNARSPKLHLTWPKSGLLKNNLILENDKGYIANIRTLRSDFSIKLTDSLDSNILSQAETIINFSELLKEVL